MNGGYGHVPYWQHLGIELQSFENGVAEAAITIKKHHTQSAGNVHGGVLASLVDSCMAAAFRSIAAPGEGCSTIDLSMRYLRSVSEGRLICRARIVHSGRKIFFCEASVYAGGELVAMAQATFRRLQRRRGSISVQENGGN